MGKLIVLHNNLTCKGYTGKEASEFCGKLVTIMLYSGIDAIDADELISTIISCSLMDRVHGNNYSKLLEFAPFFRAYMRTDFYGPRSISFTDFYDIVKEFQI